MLFFCFSIVCRHVYIEVFSCRLWFTEFKSPINNTAYILIIIFLNVFEWSTLIWLTSVCINFKVDQNCNIPDCIIWPTSNAPLGYAAAMYLHVVGKILLRRRNRVYYICINFRLQTPFCGGFTVCFKKLSKINGWLIFMFFFCEISCLPLMIRVQ